MYRLITVQKTASSDREVQSIYSYDDLIEATANMHNTFGVALKQSDIETIYCLLVDDNGDTMDKLSFSGSVEVEDPETGETIQESYTIRDRVFYISTINGETSINIAAYDNETLAKGNFHTRLASLMNNENCSEAIVACIDGQANYLEFSAWIRPVDEEE